MNLCILNFLEYFANSFSRSIFAVNLNKCIERCFKKSNNIYMTKIKTLNSYKSDYMNAKTTSDFSEIKPVISSFTEFDSNGHVIEEINYQNNGGIEQKFQYKYNEKGLLVEQLLINDEEFIDEKKTFEYNENNIMIKELLFYQDETFDTTDYIYNNEGNLIEKITFDSDGEMESCKEILSENGNKISEINFDSEKNVLKKISYKYNEKGDEVEVVNYDAVEDITVRTEYVFDENGIRSETLTYNTNNVIVEHNFYTENEKGQLIELIEDDQFKRSITVFSYDEKGNMIEQLETNETGEINQRLARKFDENNNLTEVAITIDRHGQGLNQNYMIQYVYEYFQ